MRQKRMRRRRKEKMKKNYTYMVTALAVFGLHSAIANKVEAKAPWADDNFLQYVNYSSAFSTFKNSNDTYDESNLQANLSYNPKFPNNLSLSPKKTGGDDDGYALGGTIFPTDLPSPLVEPAKMGHLEFKVDTTVRIDDNDTLILVTNGTETSRQKDSGDTGMSKVYSMTSNWKSFSSSINSIQFILDDVNTPLSRFESIKMSVADVVGPGLQNITVPNAGDGKFRLSETIDIVLHFDEIANIDTSFELPMNTGKKAVYYSGDGTKDITFHYTVVADDMTRSDIGKQPYNQGRYLGIGVRTASEWNLDQGGDDKIGAILPPNVEDLSDNEMPGSTLGNPYSWKSKYDANYNNTGGTSYYNQLDSSKLQVDGIVPIINRVDVATSTGTKYLKAGDKLTIKLLLDDAVTVDSGYIQFNNGKKALYKSGSGTKDVTYEYVVQPGDEGNELAYTHFIDNLGITDDFGNLPMVQNGYTPSLSLSGDAINVDAVLPTVEFIPDTNGTYERQHTVNLNVIEKGSGLQGDVLKYAWVQNPDEQSVAWVTYGVMDGKLPAVSKDMVNGDWYVTVLMQDRAGNINRITSPAIKFDNIVPDLAITPNGDERYLGALTPKVDVNDAHAGPDDARLEYQWVYYDDVVSDNGWLPFHNHQPVQSSKFPEYGRYTLYVRAFDKAGNEGDMVSLPFYLDTKPPEITLTPDGSLSTQRNQTAKVIVIDANSKLRPIEYAWSADADPKDAAWKSLGEAREVSTDGESLPLEGVWYLHVRAADEWGNENVKSKAFLVDNTPPRVSFDVAPSATESVKTAKVGVRAVDANSIPELYYQWTSSDAKPDAASSGWVSFLNGDVLTKNDGDGNWYLHIKSVDTLGNVSIDTSRAIKLSNVAPKAEDFEIEMPTHTNVKAILVHIRTASKEPYTIHVDDQNHTEIRTGAIKDGSAELVLEVPDAEGTYHYYFSFENEVNNNSTQVAKTIVVDKTLPVAEAVYSTLEPTRQPVTVRLNNLSDNVTTADKLELPNGDAHEFKENGSYTFKVVDQAGNERLIPVHVTNIDTVVPNIQIEEIQGMAPSQSVSAAVYGSDNATDKADLSLSYQWSLSKVAPEVSDGNWTSAANETVVTATTLANGEWYFHVKAVDRVGNTAIHTSEKLIVKRKLPIASITYSTADPTANTVTAHITFDELDVRALNTPGGIPYREFTENGSFIFEFEDEAGNRSSAEAKVEHINAALLKADIAFSTKDFTKDDVTVTVGLADSRYTLTGFTFEDGMGEKLISSKAGSASVTETVYGSSVTEAVYSVAHNGLIGFVIHDTTGAQPDQPVKVPVWNIDKTAPAATLRYGSSGWTRNDVTVSLLTEDESPVTVTNNGGNRTVVLKENGTFTFEFQDAAGNHATMTAEVKNIDKEPPTAVVSYTTTDPTNKPVTATLQLENNSGAPVKIVNNGGEASYTFTENGTFTFILRDQAGNESLVPVEVSNIDTVKPTGSVTYSTKSLTNGDVVAELSAADDNSDPVTITSAGGSRHMFNENGVFTFTFTDKAGNVGTVVAGVNWIDKTPPRGFVTASETRPTQNDVTLTLSLPDGGDILNNDGKDTIVAHEKGDYTFQVADALGNTADIVYKVSNIDRKAPIGQIVYSTDGPTNKDVIATVVAGEEFRMTNNNGSKQHVFTENGEYVFELVDEAGNTSAVKATVGGIDRTAPNVTVKYSETRLTNKSVTASVYSEDGETLIGINNDEKTSLVLKQNGTFTFIVADEAGNRTRVSAKVQNIDKNAPAIKFANPFMVFLPGETVNLNDYEAYDDRDGALRQEDVSLNPPAIDASQGGEYEVTYRASDMAGNVAEVKRPVKVLSPKDFLVLVNGQFEPSGQYMVEGSEVKFKVVNFVERYQAAYKAGDGMLKSGDFKISSEALGSDGNSESAAKEIVYQAKKSGWHTFMFQDLNRRTSVINIYFLGSGSN